MKLFFVDITFVQFDRVVLQQTASIPMFTNCDSSAPWYFSLLYETNAAMMMFYQ